MIRIFALSALLLPPALPAAPPERAQVLEVIQRFFDCLAAKDMVALQTLVLPGTQITTWRPTPDGGGVRRRAVEEDVKTLPSGSDALLERMWNPTVLVQGRVATVWTPYDFHRNGKFSHSGTDVFTLLKTAEGWRIVSLVYTVEPEVPSAYPSGAPSLPSNP